MVIFDRVWKDYRRGSVVVPVLRDVSVEIPSGAFWALMGPSGTGKSTFLNLIAGLDSVSSGTIRLEGRSTQGFSDGEWTRWRREWMGMVFQAFHLVPSLTAAQNVALPLRLSGKSSKVISSRVADSLERVGMSHREDHRPSELSGGEQQRVAIARAIVHDPRVILADEPTGNLDAHQAFGIMKLLHGIAKDKGQTVILATHSQTAVQVADDVSYLEDGQIHHRSVQSMNLSSPEGASFS
ncbi:MAG: ABC transporter ATP-binding protein [Nitrospirota bacterium]|nr:ABC transporter ATP-binding protein [Nitrospirota bacterium]